MVWYHPPSSKFLNLYLKHCSPTLTPPDLVFIFILTWILVLDAILSVFDWVYPSDLSIFCCLAWDLDLAPVIQSTVPRLVLGWTITNYLQGIHTQLRQLPQTVKTRKGLISNGGAQGKVWTAKRIEFHVHWYITKKIQIPYPGITMCLDRFQVRFYV